MREWIGHVTVPAQLAGRCICWPSKHKTHAACTAASVPGLSDNKQGRGEHSHPVASRISISAVGDGCRFTRSAIRINSRPNQSDSARPQIFPSIVIRRYHHIITCCPFSFLQLRYKRPGSRSQAPACLRLLSQLDPTAEVEVLESIRIITCVRYAHMPGFVEGVRAE